MSQRVIITTDENGNLPKFTLADASGNLVANAAYGNSDATAATVVGQLVGAEQLIYDQGANNYARQRSNTNIAALANAARTSSPVQLSYTNYNWKNMFVVIKVNTVGTGGLTPKISFNWTGAGDVAILSPAQITLAGTYIYAIGSDAPAAAGAITGSLVTALGKTIKVDVTHADASSWTYSVDVGFAM